MRTHFLLVVSIICGQFRCLSAFNTLSKYSRQISFRCYYTPLIRFSSSTESQITSPSNVIQSFDGANLNLVISRDENSVNSEDVVSKKQSMPVLALITLVTAFSLFGSPPPSQSNSFLPSTMVLSDVKSTPIPTQL